MAPNNMNFIFFSGGQFAPARGDQFGPARPGQIKPARGGQLIRRLQYTYSFGTMAGNWFFHLGKQLKRAIGEKANSA